MGLHLISKGDFEDPFDILLSVNTLKGAWPAEEERPKGSKLISVQPLMDFEDNILEKPVSDATLLKLRSRMGAGLIGLQRY